jgi:hypothetical protein
MPVTLTDNVLRDDLALTVAKVLSVANQRAEAAGINAVDSLISVNQSPRAEGGAWQVEYGPQNAVGRRGGGLTVEVAADGETVMRVLRGQ